MLRMNKLLSEGAWPLKRMHRRVSDPFPRRLQAGGMCRGMGRTGCDFRDAWVAAFEPTGRLT